jgi:NAD(P)-dependent dehydrogenase (short-subunit alcohol dehydrogenase family)
MDLKGKTAIVTGASTGIGKEIARAYARAGANTVLAARSKDKLEALAAEIQAEGGSALVAACDVTREAQVEALFESTIAAFGTVDIVVNNAGIADHTATDTMTLDRWNEVIAINMTSAFLCSRAAFRLMKTSGKGGRILNIGSISAKVPRNNTLAYTASKFAIGIAVSMLHPGSTVSDLVPGVTNTPRPNTMMPEDVARLALLMVTLPADVNLLESTILPVGMPFLGRG